MDNKRDLIHKILDDDAGEEEKRSLAQDMEKDARVREEFSGLEHTVRMLEKSERREPPAFFTQEVMKRLPKKELSLPGRLREFLFAGHVLRWNMATAMGLVVFVLVAAITVSRVSREPAMVATGPVENAVSVRLTFYAPRARTVSVAGDFNKWKTDADAMRGTEGMWSIDLKLKPGVYSYSFVVDGKSWVADPGAETYEDDGFGSRNGVLKVAI